MTPIVRRTMVRFLIRSEQLRMRKELNAGGPMPSWEECVRRLQVAVDDGLRTCGEVSDGHEADAFFARSLIQALKASQTSA